MHRHTLRAKPFLPELFYDMIIPGVLTESNGTSISTSEKLSLHLTIVKHGWFNLPEEVQLSACTFSEDLGDEKAAFSDESGIWRFLKPDDLES